MHRASLITFLLIVALFISARLWRLSAACLWFDEIFSVHAARHTWGEMLRFVAADIIHPPMFYGLLKLWISVGGESVLWLRLLPAILSIVSIIPFLLLARELRFRQGDVNLALLLLAVNGYLIKYAQEVRMYSLLLFLSLCSFWLFLRLINQTRLIRSDLILLGLINLLLVYTHYAGWFVVLFQVVAVAIWQRRVLKSFLLSVAIILAAYVPWIYQVMVYAEPGKGLAQNIGWVTQPRLIDLVQYFVLLNRPFLFSQSSADLVYFRVSAFLALLIIGFPLLLFFWRFIPERVEGDGPPRRSIWILLLFCLGPLLLALGLSWLLPYSVWGTRHLIAVSPLYAILVALALRQLRPHWIRLTANIALACWIALTAVVVMPRQQTFIWCAWEGLAGTMMSSEYNKQQVVPVYAFEDLNAYHLWFYFDSVNAKNFRVFVVKGDTGVAENPAYFLPRRFSDLRTVDVSEITGERVWIAFRAGTWDESQPPLTLLKNAGYRMVAFKKLEAQGQQAYLVELQQN